MRTLYAILLSCSLLLANAADAQTVPSYVPLAGLAAWYPFTRNAGDSSGNGNNGTVFGATLTTDRFGNAFRAYSFNGTSDYIRINTTAASSLNLKYSFSIAAWFKADWQTLTRSMKIFWRGDATYASDPYSLYLISNGVVYRRDVNAGTTINLVTYNLAGVDTSKWHHVVGTYDTTSNLMTVYVDGVSVAQSTLSGTILYNTSNHYNTIGNSDAASNEYFKGSIDDIGVWSRALTQCEVTQLYNASVAIINGQPANATATAGTTATFSISDLSSYATYQWMVDSGSGFVPLYNQAPYSGVNTKTLSISPVTMKMNGYQFQCMRNGGACVENSSSARLTVNASTGVSTARTGSGFSIYPNPNKGRFTLTGANGLKEAAVTVTDMAGRVISEQYCNLTQGTAQLDFAGKLAPGAYMLKVSSGSSLQALMFSVTE